MATGEVELVGVAVTAGVFELSASLDGFFISDLPVAPWSGVLVTVPSGSVAVQRGDLLRVAGQVTEWADSTSLQSETQLQASSAEDVEVTGSAEALVPLWVNGTSAVDEAYEGCLVRIEDQVVVETDVGGGRYDLESGVRVSPRLHYSAPGVGDAFASITGVVTYNTFADGRMELAPRDSADLEPSAP